jgi:hypothetical protein
MNSAAAELLWQENVVAPRNRTEIYSGLSLHSNAL